MSANPSDDFARVVQVAARYGVRWYLGDWPHFDPELGHAADCADDLAHEVAHWLVAAPKRRLKPYFGLGHPGLGADLGEWTLVSSELSDRLSDREEQAASLLGIGILFDCDYGAWGDVMWVHSWDDVDTMVGMLNADRMLARFERNGWISGEARAAVRGRIEENVREASRTPRRR